MKLEFPKGFLWGAATSAYQVEGGIENNDWARAAREGKVPVAGEACDHYNRFETDFDIAKSLGHNAHRFSIEWARIEPKKGEFDEKEIEHYRRVLLSLRERGIEPMVTLWHFTLPQWFVDRGGFERADAPELFARYCAHVAEQLGDLCSHFSTMNEPFVYTGHGWLRGVWPPFKRVSVMDKVSFTDPGALHQNASQGLLAGISNYFRVLSNLAHAHNTTYDAIKRVQPEVAVGITKQTIAFSGNWNPFNKLAAAVANYIWTYWFMRRVYRKCDEIGLNYYHYKEYGDRGVYPKTDTNWDARPDRIYNALMLLSRYGKPLFVSEAGLADEDDDLRSWYITEQVAGVHRAIKAGADVRGHLYWSLLDNYEWALGFGKRFGLVEVDFETQERKIRPSALEYKKICESNVLEY